MAKVTIWHNPKCSTSRNALARLREKGIEPAIYLYAEEKPAKAEIEAMLKKLGVTASALLRRKQEEAKALAGATDAQILAAMAQDAMLIERPIVIGPKGAVLARPIEKLDAVL
ncbi:MAG: arsenate reductase (glutaredoxin) [Hyphomonadaceae bacterium]